MNTYQIRLVCEAGEDPLTGEQLSHAEEIVAVDASDRYAARSAAQVRTKIRANGRILRTYDADTGEELLGRF